ncbi:MAG TPA: energy transducer TonB, partial [Pyrinomonadaceae bacterium]
NFAEFVTAMEWSLTKGGEQTGTLTPDKDFDEGRAVKQYELQIRDTKSVVRFMEAGDSLYAQFVIGADKTDPDARRFLDSLEVGKTNNDDEPNVTNVIATSEGGNASQDLPPEPWPGRAAPITGGVLNGKAGSLGRPEYPTAARANYDQGQVRVQILIDEFGKVISAVALSGPPTLREAAVKAALKSRFTPTRLMGQPVKVTGVIIYNFVAQ